MFIEALWTKQFWQQIANELEGVLTKYEESIDIIKMRLQHFQGKGVALSKQEYTELYDALESLKGGSNG
jgi:hypothetical protein